MLSDIIVQRRLAKLYTICSLCVSNSKNHWQGNIWYPLVYEVQMYIGNYLFISFHDHNRKLRTTLPTTTKGLPKSLVTHGINKAACHGRYELLQTKKRENMFFHTFNTTQKSRVFPNYKMQPSISRTWSKNVVIV